MKLPIIITILISSTIGFTQTINRDSVKSNIMTTFFNHLDSIQVENPIEISCISQAADHQARHMNRNSILGHTQLLSHIGDTIIENSFNRVYHFCDTNYKGDGEICALSVFNDSLDLINHAGDTILAQFMSSLSHKKCLEDYHEYYGISVIITKSLSQYLLRTCIVYGTDPVLSYPQYPKYFTINKERVANYRKMYSNTIVR